MKNNPYGSKCKYWVKIIEYYTSEMYAHNKTLIKIFLECSKKGNPSK